LLKYLFFIPKKTSTDVLEKFTFQNVIYSRKGIANQIWSLHWVMITGCIWTLHSPTFLIEWLIILAERYLNVGGQVRQYNPKPSQCSKKGLTPWILEKSFHKIFEPSFSNPNPCTRIFAQPFRNAWFRIPWPTIV
jgi:hypothetical protein